MKKLSKILAGIETGYSEEELQNLEITSVTFDSRKVDDGCLFVAIKGTSVDGHKYINNAVEGGARVIICQEYDKELNPGVLLIKVDNSRKVLSIIASNYYNNPSGKLKLTGITGTNGKTTCASLLYSLFTSLGCKTGLISTITNKIGKKKIPSTHTTPDPMQLNRLLNQMVEAGSSHCFMEVSSHAIDQDRITGLDFVGGIFTNISHDHLDYHKTFKAYIQAKKQFFDSLPSVAFALTNIDDNNGEIIVQNSKAVKHTYSLQKLADFSARIIENQIYGLQLNIDGIDVWFALTGKFNAYNLLAVFAAASLLGEGTQKILAALSSLKPVEGRFEVVRTETNITGIIDYAHSPDALKNVLETINGFRTRNESLITVFGAGGNRDETKRPLMGKIVALNSDKVIITSDNPRYENPDLIIKDIIKGIDPEYSSKTAIVTDREEAIKTACMMAESGDIILLAGKGHEKYQEIGGQRFLFDDKKILERYLLIKTSRS